MLDYELKLVKSHAQHHFPSCTENLTRAPKEPSNFDLPFEGQLSENNRWVIMAKIIPWSEFLLMNMPKNSPVQ
ncbi:hypothetical protein, partial [Microcoleus sp. PH2017_02_FOX_O_A]|uniref:hypothetical protein n=1 Tax=Microcoleus sp. PH2017_02_FOX_O_A TaxID=2798813 RepID=UPI0025E1107B